MPAPAEEWLAHLSPAVALGPVGRLTMRVARLASRLLLGGRFAPSRALLSPHSAPASGGSGPAAPSAQTAVSDSDPFFSPNSGGMSFLVGAITMLAALAGLVALARLLVGEDFFSLRWLR
jgi:hypothetical protein